jgi:hypothetical protein
MVVVCILLMGVCEAVNSVGFAALALRGEK